MIRKLVYRYYCEYCRKAGCSGGHIRHHEERCTLNPQRECGCCDHLLQQEQPNMADILATLPLTPDEWGGYVHHCLHEADGRPFSIDYSALVKAALPAAREAAKNCPACLLAALRIHGIPSWLHKEIFDYKAEMSDAWDVFNRDHA